MNRFKTSLRLVTAALLLLATTVALVGSVGACSAEAKTFLNSMSAVPKSCGQFTYWATSDIDADEDLWDIYGKFKESAEAKQVENLVQVLAKVTEAARAVTYENATAPNSVAVLRGDFDAKFVEGRLETMSYKKKLYKEVGIWSLQDDQASNSVALRYRTILVGDATRLEAYIDVVTKGKAESLDEDPNILLMTGKLPNGLIVEINRANPAYGEQYTDLVAYGKSYAKAKKDTLKMTAVYMFADGRAAGSAQQEIENYLAARFTQYKTQRDGYFIIATAQISISEFAQSLTF